MKNFWIKIYFLLVCFPVACQQKLLVNNINTANMINSLPMKPHASINKTAFEKQYSLHKNLWDKSFEFLRKTNLATIADGKYELAGDSAFVIVSSGFGKPESDTKWEAHKQYIDLQYVASGKETIGVAALHNSKETMAYDKSRDVANYETSGHQYLADSSTFFIFFPEDVHRPNIKVDEFPVKKIVIKILVAQ